MEKKQNMKDFAENKEEKEKLEIKLNNIHFATSIVSITEMVQKKSKEYMEEYGSNSKSHMVLQKKCATTLNHYRDSSSTLDESKIIKKVYRTLRDNMELLTNKDPKLFDIKDPSTNRLVTIIPGVDIGLLYPLLEEKEQTRLWQFLSLLFISNVNMVHAVNQVKKERKEKIDECVKTLKKSLVDTGIDINGILFNPYVGLSGSTEYGITELYAGEDPTTKGEGGMQTVKLEKIAGMLGINVDDMSNDLMEKCKNITDEEIDEVINNVTSMVGVSGDNDVNSVCGTMIKHVLKDIKENGIDNLTQTAHNTINKMEKEMDIKKMKKTASKMKDYIDGSYDKLENMKDEKGNNIGKTVMGLLKTFTNQSMPGNKKK